MIGLYKLLVFSCALSVVFGFTSVRDDANWFKNEQRIKNRFVTGVVNGITDSDCTDTVNGENVEGECLSKVECTKSGGKVGKLCSLLGSCCVLEKTCSQTTSSKLSYFVPPSKFQTECALNVNIYSKDVCQLRLDFEKFDIEKPTSNKVNLNNNTEGLTSYQCRNDSFVVDAGKVNLGFPHLCGKNNGQHIYIPVAENQQKVVLTFNLKDRTRNNSNLVKPEWRIKIRQLECRKSGYEHLLNAPSKLMAMYNTLKNKKQPKSDWELIAPPGCLQYYPKKTGTFESFNYDEGRGCYIGHLNYAICFRKAPDVCGAKYSAEGIFQMNHNKNENTTQKEDECHPTKPASFFVSQDYIQISGGTDSQNLSKDNYCDGDLNNNVVVAKPFGLLYVGVHTDEFRAKRDTAFLKAFEDDEGDEDGEDDKNEIGFRIRYELFTGNCDILF